MHALPSGRYRRSMKSAPQRSRDEIGDYYASNTHVHRLLAHDDELRFPDGSLIDDETITLDEYRAMQ